MLQGLKNELSIKETENGATALNTTGDTRLDWFAECGALRNVSEIEILTRFSKVLSVDKLDAMKLLFYTRDTDAVGERRTFRIIFKYLAESFPELVIKNLHLVSEFGRWDDIVETCMGTPCEDAMVDLIGKQLAIDLVSENEVTLLGKWLPSPNTSSKETRAMAKKIYTKLDLSERDYRKMLSTLRKKINVTECLMSSNNWDKIDYNKITSKNNLLYANAFKKHDEDRYLEHISKVISGEATINVGKLFPYEIVRRIRKTSENRKELDTIWNNLPNYVPQDKDILCVVDTSGSMTFSTYSEVTPIDIAISLGLLCAKQNNGAFKNHFMTFSSKPQLVEVPENLDIYDTVKFMERAEWGMSTNLESVFDLVLRTAIKNKMSSKDIPNLVVISDMEVNRAARDGNMIFAEAMKKRFEEHGFEFPSITWWNVDARNQTFLASKDSENMALVSGASSNLFDTVATGGTPIDVMYSKVLNNERYSCITV